MTKVERHRSGGLPVGKNWCFTINNPTPADLASFPLTNEDVKYATYGKEEGEDGTPHLQGYLQLVKPRRYTFVKALLPRGHHEVQKSKSNVSARDYCYKQDTHPFQQGSFTPSANDSRKGGSSVEKSRSCYESIRRGDNVQSIIDSQPELVGFIHQVAKYAPSRRGIAKVLYLHGTTGSGKTTSTLKVVQKLGLSYFKKMPSTHWFDGYTGQQVLVLEEFQSCFTCTKFLSMCDPSPPQLEIKGGSMPNRATHFIICSNSGPYDQYLEVQSKRPRSFAAFLRRLTHVFDCSDIPYCVIEACIETFLTEM